MAGGEPEREPLYGNTNLPRKFKTAFALPPTNDVDVFSQDFGFVAIVEKGRLAGYNVTAGGGRGMSHGNDEKFPRLWDVLGFILPDQVIAIGEAMLTTQRDYGNRTNRKGARKPDKRGAKHWLEFFLKTSRIHGGKSIFPAGNIHWSPFVPAVSGAGWILPGQGLPYPGR